MIPLRAGRWNRVWLTEDRRTVVKSYADRRRAENEAAALRLLADHRVPAPRLVDVRLLSGRAVVTMSAVRGDSLDRHAAVRAAPEVLARVHTVRGNWYGRVAGDDRFDSWNAYLAARIAVYLAHVEREPWLASRLPRAALTDLPHLVESACPEPRLLHNDLHAAHFVGDPATLVDWEHSVFGDPLFDIARFGYRAGLAPRLVAQLAGPAAPAGSRAERLLNAYRRIALLAHISLGVGRQPADSHRVQSLRALAELTGDTRPDDGPAQHRRVQGGTRS